MSQQSQAVKIVIKKKKTFPKAILTGKTDTVSGLFTLKLAGNICPDST